MNLHQNRTEERKEYNRKMVEKMAFELVSLAEKLAINVVIERVPHKPLSMGNAGYKITTSESNRSYRNHE